MLTSGDRLLVVIATVLVPVAIALMRVHTMFTLLTVPFCFGAPLGAAVLVSPWACGKPFVPISRSDTDADRREQAWTDHVLTWGAILSGIVLLFVFGEIADCLRHENVWKADLLPVTIDVCELLHPSGSG